MVSLFSLFKQRQILLQFIFGGPSRAVNALQLFVVLIASPIRARHLHQLEVLELACAGHVRATAQVFKRPFAVKANFLVSRNAGNDFSFVMLAQRLEIRYSFITRQHSPNHRLILVGKLLHFLFYGYKVLGRKRPLVGKVVIKTILNNRANGDLSLWEQSFDRIR